MAKILYTPAVLVNDREEFFLSEEKYETEEIPTTILKSAIEDLKKDLEIAGITYKVETRYEGAFTRITPSRPTPICIDEKIITLKSAEFLNHTFEVINLKE